MIQDTKHMNRRWSNLTFAEIQEICDTTPVEQFSRGYHGCGPHMPAWSDDLTGKTFIMNFDDGLKLTYTFKSTHELVWSDNSGEEHEEYVDVLTCLKNVYFINHYVLHSAPPTAHMLVIDLETGLVTADTAHLLHPLNARECYREFHFGLIEGFEDPGYRHDYTDEMVGKSILWTYHDPKKAPPIQHIYTSPAYYTSVMAYPDQEAMWSATNPVVYIKLRDGVYIFSFVEERQTGVQGFFMMDLNGMHDVGSFFGVSARTLECYTFGAIGEYTTPYYKPSERK